MLESKEHARQVHSILHTAWWEAYRVRHISPANAEIERLMMSALDRVTKEAVAKFANPAIADCDECKRNSIFGGPGHEPSRLCRSGKRPHCTCDACY